MKMDKDPVVVRLLESDLGGGSRAARLQAGAGVTGLCAGYSIGCKAMDALLR